MDAKEALSVSWGSYSALDHFTQAAFVKGNRIMDMVRSLDDLVAGLEILEINAELDSDMVIYPALPWIDGLLDGMSGDTRAHPPVYKCYEVLSKLATAHPEHWPAIYEVLDHHQNDANVKGSLKRQVSASMQDIRTKMSQCKELGIIPFENPNIITIIDTTPVTYELV